MKKADVALFHVDELNLPAMNDQSFQPLAVPLLDNHHQLQRNEHTYCLHYGWEEGHPPDTIMVSEERISAITPPTNPEAPYIVWRTGCTTSGGSSGAPLFERESNHLVGIHFASGIAILFSPTVQEILRKLISAIAELQQLPTLIGMLSSDHIPFIFHKAILNQIKVRSNNIKLSIGGASVFMQLCVPISEGRYISVSYPSVPIGNGGSTIKSHEGRKNSQRG